MHALQALGARLLRFAGASAGASAAADEPGTRKRTRSRAAMAADAAQPRAKENTPGAAKRGGGDMMTQSTRKRAKPAGAQRGGSGSGAEEEEEAVPRVLEERFVEEVRGSRGACAAAPRRGAIRVRGVCTRPARSPRKP
jgi:hypothetical protein